MCKMLSQWKDEVDVNYVDLAENYLICFAAHSAYNVQMEMYECNRCSRQYRHKAGWYQHRRYECGKEAQFQCPLCPYKAKQKQNLKSHIVCKHRPANLMNLWNMVKIMFYHIYPMKCVIYYFFCGWLQYLRFFTYVIVFVIYIIFKQFLFR